MAFDYYYGISAEQYSFYRIPKSLMFGDDFRELSLQAKLLYGLLLDRMGMSSKKKWIDNENRVYVEYPISEIQDDMNVSGHEKGDWFWFTKSLVCEELCGFTTCINISEV